MRSAPVLFPTIILVVSACDGTSPSAPSSGHSSPSLRYSVVSECGGQTEIADSRTRLEWSTVASLGSASGLEADGSAYEGGKQGVAAKLFYHDGICSRSGDVVFDPDKNNFKPARKLIVRFPAGNALGLASSGTKVGPHITFSALMQLGSDVTWDAEPVGRDAKIEAKYPGASRALEYPASSADRPGYPAGGTPTPNFRISLGIAGCEIIEYALIRSTRTSGFESFEQLVGQRTSDATPLGQWKPDRNGQWVVESVETSTGAGHAAQCYVTKKGSLVKNGPAMNMPFRVSISELVT